MDSSQQNGRWEKNRFGRSMTRKSEEEVCADLSERRSVMIFEYLCGSSQQSGGQEDTRGGEAASSPVLIQ